MMLYRKFLKCKPSFRNIKHLISFFYSHLKYQNKLDIFEFLNIRSQESHNTEYVFFHAITIPPQFQRAENQ